MACLHACMVEDVGANDRSQVHRCSREKKGCFLKRRLIEECLYPAYSYVFTYTPLGSHLSCSLGEPREGSKKKKREGERFIIVAQRPWTLRSFFRLFLPSAALDIFLHLHQVIDRKQEFFHFFFLVWINARDFYPFFLQRVRENSLVSKKYSNEIARSIPIDLVVVIDDW